MSDLNDQISVDPEAVMSSMEKTIGQQAGVIARYESVIIQLQERIKALASRVPAEDND